MRNNYHQSFLGCLLRRHRRSLAGSESNVLDRPSISSTVGYGGVRQPVKWRVRLRVRPREPGKLWLVLSCIDSRDAPLPVFTAAQGPRGVRRGGKALSVPARETSGRPLLQGRRALQCKKISVGDCRAEFFGQFNHFLCQEVGICVKDNKRKVLSCSNHWREWTLIWIVSPNIPISQGVENTWEIL